jgi:uncharacterized protein YdeI (YjbR/CyaY-like superfamily)
MRIMAEPVYFASPEAFRDWLERHGATADELLVGFHKVGSGVPSMTWPQAVDEALCQGWIDGVRRRVDEQRYQIRFTPRRPGSIWSAVNVARVEALTREGRMRPAGLAAFARRTEARTAVYTHEQSGEPALTPAMKKRLKADKAAWAWFEAQPPGWKRKMLRWALSAKQDATRERRLDQVMQAAAAGQRLFP